MPLKDQLSFKADPIYLIDGSTFVYRGFYAFPDLKRSDGFPTNALFIVLRVLLKLLREENPRYLAFFLDGRKKSYRHELLPSYKAQRQSAPESLVAQIEPIKEAVGLLGIRLHVADGSEADDCICSVANRYKSERPVVIVGSDKDLNQCLDDNVFVWDPGLRSEKLVTKAAFREQFRMDPAHWPDFQALVGDSSDNIPGVPGIGPKTALAIMERFPTLEDVRDHLDDLKPAERKKIEPNMDAAFLYRELTRLQTTQCADMDMADFRRLPVDDPALRRFLASYEFRTMLTELPPPKEEFLPLFQFPKAEAAQAETVGPAGLPDLTGREVGLICREGDFLIGLQDSHTKGKGRELRYTGTSRELARSLAPAGLVCAPSLKDLLSSDPAWSEVPLVSWFDLSLAAYLLNPEERNYSWERISQTLAAELPGERLPMGSPGLLALGLGRGLRDRLKGAGLTELMHKLEVPLIPVLVAMEQRGIAIDRDAFASFLEEVSRRLGELNDSICVHAGGEFNLRSSQQLGEVLFDRLGLKTAGKTPGGAHSTAVPVLMKLADKHPIVRELLEYRKLEKLRSTYLEPLPRLVDGEGRVHTTFNNLATATGRLSSSGPNLQNIPIRGEFGKRMRSCFVAGPGNLLAAADYSQIELRILADMSQDQTLVDAFRRGEDIHARTASLLFDTRPEDITPDQRRGAKTINFGLLYGMGPQKMAQDLGITVKAAKEFIAKYFSRLTRLREFYEGIVEEAKKVGYVTTVAGRRRLLPDLVSRNDNLAETARRQAINTRIQGSAADIIKLAMLAVEHDEELHNLKARLILQVHDELLIEAPEATIRPAGERLAEIMRTVYQLSVPVDVDWGVGKNWGEAH